MIKQVNKVSVGLAWLSAWFVVLILGCNHLYGYSVLDSFLDSAGIGSWTSEGKMGLHITALITIPLLLLSMIQTARYLNKKVPYIFIVLFVGTGIWSEIYPTLTERVVSFGDMIIRSIS